MIDLPKKRKLRLLEHKRLEWPKTVRQLQPKLTRSKVEGKHNSNVDYPVQNNNNNNKKKTARNRKAMWGRMTCWPFQLESLINTDNFHPVRGMSQQSSTKPHPIPECACETFVLTTFLRILFPSNGNPSLFREILYPYHAKI